VPSITVPLFGLALEHGIEAGFVRELIRQRKLAPPTPDIAAWPWPLALRTLGPFTMLRDGEAIVFKGKAQKKPLELLKALIAHGGRNVDAAMLTALVWPEAEGDDAKASFDSNLYRLRKLLAVDGALVLAEGKLSLNPGVVWVDTSAFEHALDAEPPRIDAALALYAGPFLSVDAAVPWALPLRDRLGARLARAVLAAGQQHEDRRDYASARALYQRALELDNLAEAIYRRLMICQREEGDSAGALTTYRRCRELLSIVLGRKPAPETEAVRATLT
jgi:DNA-binding SARP family transcriptional activator